MGRQLRLQQKYTRLWLLNFLDRLQRLYCVGLLSCRPRPPQRHAAFLALEMCQHSPYIFDERGSSLHLSENDYTTSLRWDAFCEDFLLTAQRRD